MKNQTARALMRTLVNDQGAKEMACRLVEVMDEMGMSDKEVSGVLEYGQAKAFNSDRYEKGKQTPTNKVSP